MERTNFTEKQQVLLSVEQMDFLDDEVRRRRKRRFVSEVEAAHGGNHHVNRSILIREALERTFPIHAEDSVTA